MAPRAVVPNAFKLILPSRLPSTKGGRRFSLSLGERAGVRAGVRSLRCDSGTSIPLPGLLAAVPPQTNHTYPR